MHKIHLLESIRFKSIKTFFLLSLWTIWIVLMGKAEAQVNWPVVDSLVGQFLNQNESPGLSLGIVNSSSGETFTKGYGLMDKEMALPMQIDTRLLIASISKSFTAITACRILSEKFPELGEAVLDTPIVALVPTFNLTLNDRFRTEHVTFRDLLAHRTCLNSYGIGVTAGAYLNREDRLYRYRYIPEKCGFRSRFEYSNAMFVLSGAIISHIAGVPFEDLVMTFLNELEMSDSLIVTPTEDYETLDKMSRGYYRDLDGRIAKMNAKTYNSHSGAAAGGIISTGKDMGKYLMFHLNKGRVGDVQIVPKEIMEWLYEPSNHLSRLNPLNGNYAYGLALDLGLFEGNIRIGHGGDLSPFLSQITFYPDLGLGIFTGSNGPGSDAEKVQLHNDIIGSLLGLSVDKNQNNNKKEISAISNPSNRKNRIGKTKKRQVLTKMGKIDPELLIGIYGHPYEGDINILYNGTTLSFQYGIWGKGYLYEEVNLVNLYSVQWEGDIVSMFLAYSAGPPLPIVKFDFNKPEMLTYLDSDGEIEYKKNETVDTYPQIPWEEGSCF